MRIPPQTDAEILRLWGEGVSQRRIAAGVQVSRGAVQRVLSGRPRRVAEPGDASLDIMRMTKNTFVCRECGEEVHLSEGRQPCVACRARASVFARLPSRPDLGRLAFELEPQDEERRCEVLIAARAAR